MHRRVPSPPFAKLWLKQRSARPTFGSVAYSGGEAGQGKGQRRQRGASSASGSTEGARAGDYGPEYELPTR